MDRSKGDEQDSAHICLLAGECVQCVARDVAYVCPYNGPTRGLLTLTNYKLHFKSSDRDPPFIYEMPLGFVSCLNEYLY